MSRQLSLVDLEPEVLSTILEYVDDTAPITTKAVACVSRYLNQLTRSIAHRRKVIEVNGPVKDGFLSKIDLWLKDETPASIRTLTIKGRIDSSRQAEDMDWNEGSEDDEDEEGEDTVQQSAADADDESFWGPLVTLISRIGKLRQFDWNVRYPLPVTIFKALENHQRHSTLRIFNFARKVLNSQHPEPIELLLAESTALTHIRHVTEDSWVWPDLQEVAFRSIVGRAPKLQYAGLIHLRPFDRDDEDHSQMDAIRARFYKHDKPNSSIRQLTLDGVEISRKSLIDWSSTVDLNTLEMVKFTKGFPTLDYFQAASTMLPNLKHFSLNLRLLKAQPPSQDRQAMITALQNFISSCAPLQTLSLWSWKGLVPLPDLLQRHGPTLQTLQLHERETLHGTYLEVLNVDDLKSIRSACPNLKDLTFDLCRPNAKLHVKNDPNEAYYTELARFQNLDVLQIYFDLGACFLHWKAVHSRSAASGYLYSDSGEDSTDDDDEEEAGPSNHTDNDVTNQNNEQAAVDPPAPSNAGASRAKTHRQAPPAYTRPSRDTAWEPYIQAIWKTVFGHKKSGARQLDVKAGDWEGLPHPMLAHFKRHFIITPNERDDVSDAVIKTKIGGKSHLNEPH